MRSEVIFCGHRGGSDGARGALVSERDSIAGEIQGDGKTF